MPNYVLLGVLVAVLGWRLLRVRRAARRTLKGSAEVGRAYPGLDSEFYAIERELIGRGMPRVPGESLSAWGSRVAGTFDETARRRFERVLQIHIHYRFDPEGLDAAGRATLRDTAIAVADVLKATAVASRR